MTGYDVFIENGTGDTLWVAHVARKDLFDRKLVTPFYFDPDRMSWDDAEYLSGWNITIRARSFHVLFKETT